MKNKDCFYIDCEFDGHAGALLSFGIVSGDGRSIHVRTTEEVRDPWVIANVIPAMNRHEADASAQVALNDVGPVLHAFVGQSMHPTIIADSPVDIGRFCAAISTSNDGGWAPTSYPRMSFEVHNVDCYPSTLPGAVQHNAWWDAMALRHKLTTQGTAVRAEPDTLTVRDQFAMAALTGLISSDAFHGPLYQQSTEVAAQFAYRIADAMMAEREKNDAA